MQELTQTHIHAILASRGLEWAMRSGENEETENNRRLQIG